MSKIGDRLRDLASQIDDRPEISCVGIICTENEESSLGACAAGLSDDDKIAMIARSLLQVAEATSAKEKLP